MKKVMFTIVIILFGSWIWAILRGNMPLIDQWLQPLWIAPDGSMVQSVFSQLTHLGSKVVLIPLTIFMMLVFVIIYRHWFQAFILGGGTLLSYGILSVLKFLFKRERPSIWPAVNAEGFSFPSGHALIATVFYGLLIYFITKKLKSIHFRNLTRIIGLTVIVIVGLSRVILNVHYVTDILAGFLFGYILYKIFIKAYEVVDRTQS